MKLLYICDGYNENLAGVKKKVDYQIKSLNNNFETELYGHSEKSFFSRLKKFKKGLKSKDYDILYVRGSLVLPLCKNILKYISKKKILVLEIPTPLKNAEMEVKGSNASFFKKIAMLCLYKYYYPKILKYFDIIVEYAEEGASYKKHMYDKIIYINNGIDVDSISIKKNNSKENELHLIGVANISFWHGYDRIINGLFNYYNENPEKKVYFHIVGEGSELNNLKNLTNELHLGEFVVFHGKKYGKELDEVYDYCDMGIGILASHRRGLFSESALKCREYCSKGIPFILSSKDEDFENFSYALKVPNNESEINIRDILEFYNSLDINYTKNMRKYAEENLSWNAKLEPVIKRINEKLNFN